MKCITFSEEENEIDKFSEMTEDFNKNMNNYISFVKRKYFNKKEDEEVLE